MKEKCAPASLFSKKKVSELREGEDLLSHKILLTFILDDLYLEPFNFDILWLFPPESNGEVFNY